jgi:DNA repair exonuclease SbcCD ATPase subunit
MKMIMSIANKCDQVSPGDAKEALEIIKEYRTRLREIDGLRGSFDTEKVYLNQIRETLKVKMGELGVKSSQELQEIIIELKSKISEDFYKLESDCRKIESELAKLEGEKTIYLTLIENSQKLIDENKQQIQIFDETSNFLRHVSDAARIEIISKIETFVTRALEKIFGLGLFQFVIEMKVKQNVPYANFQLKDCLTKNTFGILESYGGGVGDIISIVLRLAILELQIPKNTGPIILDEVGKFLSSDHQIKFGEFLREWSETFDRQIILASHISNVSNYAHKIFKITKNEDISNVEEISIGGTS